MPFKKGDPNINRKGRIDGSISLTSAIKRELQKCPEGYDKRTYLELLVKRIIKKAVIDGDAVTIKQIWNYIDGLPKQNINLEGQLTFLSPEQKEKIEKALEEL